jgi:2-polyprenyl-6-methoxyphenol hydroxylase-like FAD-dependent oxidoreductase
MQSNNQPVIVVGASLVGLSAALCLASHHVPTIVLEKHASMSEHPRAIGFTTRTLEIYRSLGIENNDPAPEDFVLERVSVESVTGKWLDNSSWSDTDTKPKGSKKEDTKPSALPKKEYSAERGSAMPQDKLEPRLEALARERGADIRRGHRVLNVEQDDGGVLVTLQDAQDIQHQIRGSYLIAAFSSTSCSSNGQRELCNSISNSPTSQPSSCPTATADGH